MDDNLDRRSKYNLIGYLKSKVEGQCENQTLTQDASKSRNGAFTPMFELLLYSSMACPDADALILRIQQHEHMEAKIKIELVETVKESVPECYWGAND